MATLNKLRLTILATSSSITCLLLLLVAIYSPLDRTAPLPSSHRLSLIGALPDAKAGTGTATSFTQNTIISTTYIITSDERTEYLAENSWFPAVPAQFHPGWPQMQDATWIWTTASVPKEERATGSDIETFRRRFSLPLDAVNIVGNIQITADNAYEILLNGEAVGSDGTLDVSSVDDSLLSVEIFPTLFRPGANELVIRAINYGATEVVELNPAGIVYHAEVTYQQTLLDGLAAFYPFDGDSRDQSGNEYHGSSVDSSLSFDVYGVGKSAYHFSNEGSVVTATTAPVERDHTISAWVYIESLNADGDNGLVTISDDGGIVDYGLFATASQDFSGQLKFVYVLNAADGQIHKITAERQHEVERWYHLTGTYDGNTARLFINGLQMAVVPLDIELRSLGTILSMGNHGLSDSKTRGRLDEVRLYERVLNLNEVRALLYKVPSMTLEDSDDDGLPDLWEINGIDHDGDGEIDVDLPSLGADPLHKDIFVEIDYMVDDDHSHRPNAQAIQAIVDSFNDAPVNNPNGETGIHLHVDYGSDAPLTWGDSATWGEHSHAQPLAHQEHLSSCDLTSSPPLFKWHGFDAVKRGETNQEPNFMDARRAVFHYNLWAHSLCESVSSVSLSRNEVADPEFANGGSDFVVSFGDSRSSLPQEAATFMHALGHNLGLRHGGTDHQNWKPNYLSIMNPIYSMRGLYRNGRSSWFDYSRYALPTLDENNLDEQVGIQLPADLLDIVGTYHFCGLDSERLVTDASVIDWNCDGDTEDSAVQKNINQGRTGYQDVTLTLLTSQNDWNTLRFTGGTIGNLGVPLAQESMVIELTMEENAGISAYPSTVYVPIAQQ